MNCELMAKMGIPEMFILHLEFPNYEISNYGNIRNKQTGRILKPKIDKYGYYVVGLYGINNKRYDKLVHRLVCEVFIGNPDNKPHVDHIDNNKLNNCDFNLRYATNQENQFNSSISKRNTSGFKGVGWYERSKQWRADIMYNGKKLHLGYFDNLEDAKKARQTKAKEFFGEYINKCEL